MSFERRAEFRHEFYRGEVFQMAGASREHNLLVSNSITSFNTQLRHKNCEVYPTDMRVHIPTTGLFTYPDVIIVCGEPIFLDDEFDTLLNPTVIIKVLSPSTAEYDRGRKFWHYQAIESLREYILVSQDKIKIEQLVKQADRRWAVFEYNDLENEFAVGSIDCRLSAREIYNKVFA